MPCAKDIMTEGPATIAFNASAGEAVRLLQTMDIRHLPVLGARGELVGMLSDRDVRSLAIPMTGNQEWVGEFFRDAIDTKVGSVMTSNVISIEVEDELPEIIELMLTHKVGSLTVIEADGTLVGIVSYIDVLRALQPLALDASD